MKFKQIVHKLFGGVIVFCAILLAVVVIKQAEQDAQAQVEQRFFAPAKWYDYSGTNYFGFNTNATLEVRSGGTTYTGGTTNLKFITGGTITNTLVIVKGIITSIQ